MRNLWMRSTLLVATIATMMSTTAKADDDPLHDPYVQKTLRAMNDASTWYHPDLFGEYAGMRRYAHHQYKEALRFFEIGAYYADKLSQLSIGLMHLNGEGVPKDPAAAYAWIDLAAERGYPDFVATRDRVKSELTPAQLAQALTKRDQLAQKYADAVAKPRMEHQLRLGAAQMTGSRTGFDSGALHASVKQDCGIRRRRSARRRLRRRGHLCKIALGTAGIFRFARCAVEGDGERRQARNPRRSADPNGAGACRTALISSAPSF